MADYDFLPTSNGSGDAALMHVQSPGRLVGATSIPVDTVVNVPTKFIGTSGTLLATGFLDPATVTNFKGHTSASTLVIDAFEPGSTDIGNTAGQVVIIKPNTGWSNRVATFIKNATGFGTPEAVTFAGVSASSVTTTGAVTVGGTATHSGATVLTGAVSGAGYDAKTQANSYKFSVTDTNAITLTSATWTKVPFDTKVFDTGSNFNTSTNRFVAPINGFYQFSAQIGVSLSGISSTSSASAALYVNGVLKYQGPLVKGSGDAAILPVIPLVALIQLSASDYVEWYAWVNESSRQLNNSAVTTYSTGFLVSAT